MCGITGFVYGDGRRDQGSLLERMTSRLAHRGPDASGYWPTQPDAESAAWLGHRRLSIVDLSCGAQPMSNEDGRIWITYNGEIFNHAALRPELEGAGHRYSSHCDTEMVVHAYEQWGPACLSSFRGMFAFALWDDVRQELFCARDRLGIKPFYYFCDGRNFIFASEIKALLEHPAVGAQPETTGFAEYLAFGYRSDPEATLFAGIRSLAPGHWLRLRVRPGCALQPEIVPYWDAPRPTADIACDERWAIEEVERRFEETVRMRLMSDVPLGVFLSGGVDSSAIAAMIRRITGGPLKTFSVGYTEEKYSELGWAQQVADHIGSEHAEVKVDSHMFFEALPELIWHEDEPIAWPSSVALYFVSKLAARDVKVVLTGEGSDEIFAGYSRYAHYLRFERQAAAWEKMPRGLRSGLRRVIETSPLLGPDLRRKIAHTPLARRSGLASLYLENFLAAFSRQELAQWTNGQNGNSDPFSPYLACYESYPEGPSLQRLLYADQKTYLVELLRKQDRMSMACSIESRVPLLDHTFVEFAASLPSNLKLRGRTGKYIFKRMAERLLPHSIVYRPKMGFPTPLSTWLAGAYGEQVASLTGARGSFCREFLTQKAGNDLMQQMRSGFYDTTDRVWRLLTLELWGRRFFRGEHPSFF